MMVGANDGPAGYRQPRRFHAKDGSWLISMGRRTTMDDRAHHPIEHNHVRRSMNGDADTGVGGANARTFIGLSAGDARPLEAREAFLVAWDRIATLAGVARAPSVVALAVAPNGRVLGGQLLGHNQTLVVGRHSECGLRLRDQDIALRHLAVHARSVESGAITVRVWDLNTGQPFRTEDGSLAQALVVEGVLHLFLGRYALLFVPTKAIDGVRDAEQAWQKLPPREFIDRRIGRPHPPHQAPFEYRSVVTMVPAATPLEESDHPAWAVLHVRSGDSERSLQIPLEQLQRGLLIGRYDRCGLRLGLEGNISRVHLLVVNIDGEIWAIDTASSNGTFSGEESFSGKCLHGDDWIRLARTTIFVRIARIEHARA
jgi:hypothetical protein